MLPLLNSGPTTRRARNSNTVAAKSYTNGAHSLRQMTKTLDNDQTQANSILPPSLTSRVTNLLGKINGNQKSSRHDSYTRYKTDEMMMAPVPEGDSSNYQNEQEDDFLKNLRNDRNRSSNVRHTVQNLGANSHNFNDEFRMNASNGRLSQRTSNNEYLANSLGSKKRLLKD